MAHIIILDRSRDLAAKVPELLELIHEVTDFMEKNGVQNPPACVGELEYQLETTVAEIATDIAAVKHWMETYGS